MIGPKQAAILVAVAVGLGVGAPASAERVAEVGRAREELEALRKSRPAAVPVGALDSIGHHLDVAERYWGKGHEADHARRYLRDAEKMLEAARAGRDPYEGKRGFVVRAYRSEISTELQPYSVYVPSSYDPSRPTPLLVVLHGGSSNHALFLGVVFGNNVPWAEYSKNLRTLYTPRYETDWLVVAPNGFGQVMWRWMGEQDVLDVIDDVCLHYNVDPDQIVLNGISNGGVGTYSIGARHAWRFAAVVPMAGAPSWRQYLRVKMTPLEDRLVSAFGAWDSADNLRNTHFEFHHGNADTGPMRPFFVTDFRDHLKRLGVPHTYKEYPLGHDIMYAVHKRMKVLKRLSAIRRDPRPGKVHLVAWDYRARRQHWIEVTGFADFAEAARVVGEVVAEGRRVRLETKNVDRLRLHLRDVPIAEGSPVSVEVDGAEVTTLAASDHPERLDLHRAGGAWRSEAGPVDEGLRKRPGLSGPLTDVLHTCQVHVYGTGVEADTKTLHKAAEQASRGIWAQWAWDYEHPVVADSELTDAMVERCTLVLYGDTKSNSVLARVAAKLPIRVEEGAIVVGGARHEGRLVGTRFVYPNPLAPSRYLVVQAGNSAAAVAAGNRLPDFLPDWVVYDEGTTKRRPRGVFFRTQPLAAGLFDERWRLRAE